MRVAPARATVGLRHHCQNVELLRTRKPLVRVDRRRQERPEADIDDANPVARVEVDRLDAPARVVVEALCEQAYDRPDVRSAQDVAGGSRRVCRVLVDQVERSRAQEPFGRRLGKEQEVDRRLEGRSDDWVRGRQGRRARVGWGGEAECDARCGEEHCPVSRPEERDERQRDDRVWSDLEGRRCQKRVEDVERQESLLGQMVKEDARVERKEGLKKVGEPAARAEQLAVGLLVEAGVA